MEPEELEEALGLKPKTDIPPAARRSLRQIGVLDASEGGLSTNSFARQDPSLVRAMLAGNQGLMVSRWGHILLRRALATRIDSPAGMRPADFAALRAALLVRMGEATVARALVQDVDTGEFTPALTQAALDSYVASMDFTGLCPAVQIQGASLKTPQWEAMGAICAAFRGEGNAALSRLDRQMSSGKLARIDALLAQKYAGAAGKARRAVKIEWDGVEDMTPWRFGMTVAVGLSPPPALMQNAGARYARYSVTAPMLGLVDRAKAADEAAGAGVLSSAAMVDLYSQIYADQDLSGEWADRVSRLRDSYVAADPAARIAAMRELWGEDAKAPQAYSRMVLTAFAAARMPASEAFSGDAERLIASMLAAGLDANAMRWAGVVDAGTPAWALLALAAPGNSRVSAGDVGSFQGDDASEDARRSAFLLAGLAGLGRLTPGDVSSLSSDMDVDLARQTRWTRAIDRAADLNNATMVAMLAGLGMQGRDWSQMTPLYLYHIVSALNRVGLGAEARMIAAEAVARG